MPKKPPEMRGDGKGPRGSRAGSRESGKGWTCPDVEERGGKCVRDNQLNISEQRDAEAEGGPGSQAKGSSGVW